MSVEPQAFRAVLAKFASGVTVVTTTHEGQDFGLTVSAFCSVSADPPQVLVCITDKSPARPAIADSGRYSVSILSRDQLDLGARFAGMIPGVTDRFSGVPVQRGAHGCLVLDGAVGSLECEVVQAISAGGHTLFVGRVLSGVSGVGSPLLYHDRAWRELAAEPLDFG